MNPDITTSLPFHFLGAFMLPIIFIVLVWTLVIKGLALWRAARNSHKAWFIVLLIVNTLGILELIYLIWFSNREKTEAPSSAAPAAPSSAPEA